ncbi:MAG: hypothetical protein WCH44_13020, partial [Betaproteobacteria bacterium]
MFIVAIAWIYVVLMMAVAQAVHPSGSWLGGIVTFVLYGVGPAALLLSIVGAPQRRRVRLERAAAASLQPD